MTPNENAVLKDTQRGAKVEADGNAPTESVQLGGGVSLALDSGDTYAFVRAGSPVLANGKVKVNTASNTELASGAYPSRITGDTNIQIEAAFSKLI